MANISKEERERRAKMANQTNPIEEIANEPTPAAQVQDDPETEVKTIVEGATSKERSVYSPTSKDFHHFQEHELEARKNKARAAIEQAKKDAAAAAIAKVDGDILTKMLVDDLGDVGRLVKFLEKFGPSNNAPPRPEPTPFGDKCPNLMEWMAKYEPQNFLNRYSRCSSPIARRLIKQAEAELA